MLRSSLRSTRLLSGQPVAAVAGRQWAAAASRRSVLLQNRYYADHPVIPRPPVLPTSEIKSSERAPTPAEETIEKKVGLDEVPLTPPPVPQDIADKAAAVASAASQVAGGNKSTPPPPPPPPPPKKKGFMARLRRFVASLILLGVVGFAGGVWYSRINDTFHDIFTEFVPFGEQAVLYLEELEFQKKFPDAHRAGSVRSAPSSSEQVRIPAQSGASWRVADSGEPVGRQSSSASTSRNKPAAKSDEVVKKEPAPAAAKPVETQSAPAPAASKESKDFKTPEVNEPSRFPPLEPIDLMSLPDAKEPIVQDLVRMLNDLILVINADNAHGKYSTTISKAKREVGEVGDKLKALKTGVEKKAAGEVKSTIAEFDKAATELVKRVENTMVQQEASWRSEFEEEMNKVRDTYEQRAKLLLEREQKLNEEKLQTKLLEQAVALKKEFVKEVQNRVEAERDGRLSKLNELTSAVADLEKLTVGWNSVLDTNLKTQQLHVAVEAVRASLEGATHPKPFIKELVALKEIAANDDVVDAAISSINPSAYQKGVSSPSYLIDRFRRVAGEVRKASLLPDDAGVASHASSWVLSHLMFKKQGLAEGNDVESILTRTQTFLEEGDLDAAAREMNGLEGWAKTLSRDWLGEVRKVLEVQQALDVIATEARLQSLRVD
ncbi:hypothetical protein LMH87_006682 [Akanthomyces muscarius]|uniref:MICOS complex subunit MIC60 n=1 Tax=Akanthomyces muscarius TaxID=2231603 RepID=A0A9W8QN83_AKAMU|nr:hypothetical protein LMH87_006682 [Akanthomyces muscarius]KAJ4165033.1 hypothetical protein LMH87_006682 [Akanthomyces muscarius]